MNIVQKVFIPQDEVVAIVESQMEMRNKAQDDEENFSSRLWRKLSLANWEIMFLAITISVLQCE